MKTFSAKDVSMANGVFYGLFVWTGRNDKQSVRHSYTLYIRHLPNFEYNRLALISMHIHTRQKYNIFLNLTVTRLSKMSGKISGIS